MVSTNILKSSRFTNLGWVIIFLSLVIGGFLRFGTLFNYSGFQGDQAFHGGFIMDIWEGKLPTLGSTTSAGGHSLTPLHYYLFWIFTIFGPNPVFQALPNAVFTFLSIPALIFFIYRLLNKTDKPLRLFLSGFAGLWWSLFYNDVLFASFEWNPNSIAFFGLTFILLIDLIVNQYIKNSKLMAFAWVFLGINTALFTSLHTTTLLLYPIIFTLFIGYSIATTKKIKLPLLSVASFVAVLAPYWIGEIQTRGQNTKALLDTLLNSQSTLTILDKVNRIFFNYFEIGPLMYFDNTITHISFVFLGLILTIGIFHFVGNKKMWIWYLITILLYFLISMNYTGIYFVHYKQVFWTFPIVLTMVTINYLTGLNNKYSKIASLIIISSLIVLSVFLNTRYIYRMFQSKYGTARQIGVSDYIEIFDSMKIGQTICTPNISSAWDRNALNFIDKYNTKKNISFVKDCVSGTIEILPKYSFPDLSQRQIPVKTIPNEGQDVIKDADSYYLIRRL